MTGSRNDNVLIVHWHDLGRYLGVYGHADVSSPRLDQLAAQGILFTRAHATAPLCSPSRGSLFTGRYPQNNGLLGLAHHGWEYRADIRTLPRILSESGWHTALFGMQERLRRRVGEPPCRALDHVFAVGVGHVELVESEPGRIRGLVLRSGSTLLVESLRATGVAGEPGEFFQYLPTTSQSPQPRQWFEEVEDESILRLLDPLDQGKPDLAPPEIWRDYIRTVGRTPNGIWVAS